MSHQVRELALCLWRTLSNFPGKPLSYYHSVSRKCAALQSSLQRAHPAFAWPRRCSPALVCVAHQPGSHPSIHWIRGWCHHRACCRGHWATHTPFVCMLPKSHWSMTSCMVTVMWWEEAHKIPCSHLALLSKLEKSWPSFSYKNIWNISAEAEQNRKRWPARILLLFH